MKIGSVSEALQQGFVMRRVVWKERVGIIGITVDGKPRVMLASLTRLADGQDVWEAQTMPFTFLDEDFFAIDWEIA
jgi:hypothetical protein